MKRGSLGDGLEAACMYFMLKYKSVLFIVKVYVFSLACSYVSIVQWVVDLVRVWKLWVRVPAWASFFLFFFLSQC